MLASYILLYVENMATSRDFYADLLGLQPVEDSPTFVLFVQSNGSKIGLWGKAGVIPPANNAGGLEIGFPLENKELLETQYTKFAKDAVRVIQAPTDMDFGRTFTALDPDGNRLRFFALSENPA